MAPFFIPPLDIRVRIIATGVRLAFFNNEDGRGLGQTDMNATYDDQYWYIIPGQGEYTGKFIIKNAFTGRCLYAADRHGTWGEFWTNDQVGVFADHYFSLEQGGDDQPNQFRLVCPYTDRVVFSRTHMEPKIGCIATRDGVWGDQWFQFELEPLDVVDIKYDMSQAVILNSVAKALGQQECSNMLGNDQSGSLEFSEEVELQSTFQHERSVTWGAEASVSAGVPVIGKVDMKFSVSKTNTFTFGTTNRVMKSIKATINLSVPPGKIYQANFSIMESEVSVPFTTTWKARRGGATLKTHGTYTGSCAYNLKTTYTDITDQKE